MEELIQKRTEVWNQYLEGAITFVELVVWLHASTTPEESDEWRRLKDGDIQPSEDVRQTAAEML